MRELLTRTNKHEGKIIRILDTLADRNSTVEVYRNSFHSIGKELGEIVKDKLPAGFERHTMLACTSEDADWLAKGFLEGVGKRDLPMAVFWGVRERLSNGVNINTIIRTYKDEMIGKCENLIVVKSIISTSCVVKSQLLRLISDTVPDRIFIVAPVRHKDAENSLRRDFPKEISDKFEFISFAIDDQMNDNKEIIPGVGGMVYPRLGLGDEKKKNSYFPQIVKDRMERASAPKKNPLPKIKLEPAYPRVAAKVSEPEPSRPAAIRMGRLTKIADPGRSRWARSAKRRRDMIKNCSVISEANFLQKMVGSLDDLNKTLYSDDSKIAKGDKFLVENSGGSKDS